jgi:hypothetical protein
MIVLAKRNAREEPVMIATAPAVPSPPTVLTVTRGSRRARTTSRSPIRYTPVSAPGGEPRTPPADGGGSALLCPVCRQSFPLSAYALERWAAHPKVRIAIHCPHCGVTNLFEARDVDRGLR